MTTSRTVISFFVSVPVLSDAITDADPSVSTALRWRTIAFRRAIRCTPIDSTTVTTAGRPSGTAATASATPRIRTSNNAERPWTCSTTTIVAIMTTAMTIDHQAQHLADAIELLLERRRLGRNLGQQSRDAPHLRPHARCDDHRPPAAVGDRRPAVDHVGAIAETDVGGYRGDFL